MLCALTETSWARTFSVVWGVEVLDAVASADLLVDQTVQSAVLWPFKAGA